MRGEFIRADGLVIPNNILTYGARSILGWALQDSGYDLWLGLSDANPSPDLDLADLLEPTLGVGGYARIQIPRGTGWPTTGQVNGETYYESAEYVFTPTAAYDKQVSRLALINTQSDVTGEKVVALSRPWGDALIFDATTDVTLRTFKYRIYAR